MKCPRILAVLLGVTSPVLVWASPVKVTHDIRADGPSQVHAEGTLQAPPDAVWKQIIRFNEYARFMPNVAESFFIREEGVKAIEAAGTKNANKLRAVARPFRIEPPRRAGQKWEGLVFMVLDTPFPVENRWYVIKSVQDETRAASHAYKRCWSLVTGNIDAAQGCWSIEPGENPEETASVYDDQADPGGNVPEWVTRMGATKTIPEMFQKVEKLAQTTDE